MKDLLTRHSLYFDESNPSLVLELSSEGDYTIDRYVIASGGGKRASDPKEWVLKGSNNGVDWKLLDRRFNQIFPYRQQERVFKFCSETSFRFYRFEFVNSGGVSTEIGKVALIDSNGTDATVERVVNVGDLMYSKFACIQPYVNPSIPLPLSGWEILSMGGRFKNEESGTFLIELDGSGTPVTMRKRFVKQNSGRIVLEFRLMITEKMEGASFKLCAWDTAILDLFIKDSMLMVKGSGQTETLVYIDVGREYGIKAELSIDEKKADIFVDGQIKASDVACENSGNVNYFFLDTGENAWGCLYINPIHIYRGYFIHEDFKTYTGGITPPGWDADENAIVQEFKCSQDYDRFSMKITNTGNSSCAGAVKRFLPHGGKLVFECNFLPPPEGSGRIEASGQGKKLLMLKFEKKRLLLECSDGKTYDIMQYRENVWYFMKIIADGETGKASVYINRNKRLAEIVYSSTSETFDSVGFYLENGTNGPLWVDDIKVYPWHKPADDYVPEPVPVDTSPYILGMQSCPLWREGVHYGWDFIRNYDVKRKPLLGWYEDGNVEAADWEIKWMVEHGIAFNYFCWYRPITGVGNPIKDTMLEAGLNGYLDAQYSGKMKFAVMLTNHDPYRLNMEDFMNYVTPYLIERFIKDPRYMMINNKPVIGVFSPENLDSDTGSSRAALDYFREECKKAGYDGAIIICNYWGENGEEIQKIENGGFDYIYAYTWHKPDIRHQKKKMLAQLDLVKSKSIGILPTICCGWDRAAWNGGGAEEGFLETGEWERLALWARDEFMQILPKDSLGRKLLMLGNWNEFGEGHFMMPSNINGFGYLDVLRSVFAGNHVPHDDVIPNERQKARFDTLYPNGW